MFPNKWKNLKVDVLHFIFFCSNIRKLIIFWQCVQQQKDKFTG